jgi:uncharacterized protein
MARHSSVVAFIGDRCVGTGDLGSVAVAVKKASARQREPILVFDAATSEEIEIDLRGTDDDVARKHAASTSAAQADAEAPRGPGRPKLGVIAREVTLLPRHWDWLNSQPGGASVALRKLVEHGMRANAGKDRIRASQNAAYKFMSVMAGNRVGFEDAARALFAADARTFNRLVDDWPKDIRDHAKRLAAAAVGEG